MASPPPSVPPQDGFDRRPGEPASRTVAASGSAWSPAGIVTLLTDFGLSDPYVGIMKGVLLGQRAGARCVDLTHLIPPQDRRAAAWTLAHSWPWFPAGTVHVAVVDPGVGTERRILLALVEGHAFLGPDNGILAPILSEGGRVFSLDVERVGLAVRSQTFHGRDVFAPAAAALLDGCDASELGEATEDWIDLQFPTPRRMSDGTWEAEVLLVDRFGNLVTGLTAAQLNTAGDGDRGTWVLEAAGLEAPLRRTYASAGEGDLLALEGSFGYLELAIRDGSAAQALGLTCGAPVRARRMI